MKIKHPLPWRIHLFIGERIMDADGRRVMDCGAVNTAARVVKTVNQFAPFITENLKPKTRNAKMDT